MPITPNMTPEEYDQAVFLLGPWLVGCFLDILLQGILFCQFVHYWGWYRDDILGLRLGVIGLCCLTTLKSVQSFALIWIQSIDYVEDLAGAINLNYTAWWQSFNSLFVAIIGTYVQAYFCYRLLVISRSYYVVAPVAIIFVFALLSQVVACYYITKADGVNIAHWFAAHLSSVFAGDLLMTGATAFFLTRSKRNVHSQTVGLISALIRLTFQTAAPAAVCAMFNLIFSQIYNGSDKLISTAFNMMLPKLYAISMMWTLNARRTIRAVHSSAGGGVTELSGSNGDGHGGHGYSGHGFSGAGRAGTRIGGRRNETVELQVRTVQETVKHIDFQDDSKTDSGDKGEDWKASV